MILKLKDLKHKLVDKAYISFPIVFMYADSTSRYLMNTYIDSISQIRSLIRINLNNLEEIEAYESDMFSESHNMYVVDCPDDFTNYSRFNNYNVIFVKEENKENPEIDTYVFKDVKNNYIEEYTQKLIPGLSKERIQYLCNICNYDIYRIDNEALKLNIFDNIDQNNLFDRISDEGGYSDLTSLTIFDFIDGIIKKDFLKLNKIYDKIKYIDIEGTGVITLLIKQFRNMIDARMTDPNNLSTLKMSPKQISYIRHNLTKYSEKELVSTYDFLTSLDFKLKSGDLDMSNEDLSTYVMSVVLDGGLS